MDAFVDSLIQLLIEWGYVGMFFSSVLAGSILPFSSEVVMAALIGLGLSPTLCVAIATVGNTFGGMTCYYMGRLGRMDWIEKYLHVKRARIERMQRFLQGKGALMAFFSFVPVVGGVMVIALGFMRSNLPLTALSMVVGKLLRYLVLVWLLLQAAAALT